MAKSENRRANLGPVLLFSRRDALRLYSLILRLPEQNVSDLLILPLHLVKVLQLNNFPYSPILTLHLEKSLRLYDSSDSQITTSCYHYSMLH